MAEHNLVGKVEQDLAEGERRCVRRHSRKDQGGVWQKAPAKSGHSQVTTAKEAIHLKWPLGGGGGDSSLESDEPVKSGRRVPESKRAPYKCASRGA